MKAVPLYEFMPYGAPELIEARRSHLSRALAVASMAAVLLYATVMAVAPILKPSPPQAAPVVPIDPFVIVPPPIAPHTPPPAPRVLPSPPVVKTLAIPIPVPDATAPPEVQVAPPGGPGGTAGAPGAGADVLPSPGAPTGEARPGIHEFVYVERVPEPIRTVKPAYSEIARQAGVEGKVLVRVLVGKDGRVLDARVEEKYSVPLLNDAALEAARQWIFTPGLSNERPVMCWVSIPFNFRLHER